jgi:hypothetical protein
MAKICPNYGGCRLVQTDVVVPDSDRKEQYLNDFCTGEETWKKCRRYTIRKALWICPDFVLPDSDISEDQVVERYEEEEEKKKSSGNSTPST